MADELEQFDFNAEPDVLGTGDLFDKKWFKIVLFVLIPGAVFFLISAGIVVSQLGIRHSVVAIGNDIWVSGKTSALRIVLMDDDQGFFLPQKIKATLLQQEKQYVLFDDEVFDTGNSIVRNFRVPSADSGLKEGPAQLKIFLTFSDKHTVVSGSLKISSKKIKEKFKYPSDTKAPLFVSKVYIDQGIELSIITEDRGAPAGLSSLLFLAAFKKNEPVQVGYSLVLPSFSRKKEQEIVKGKTGLLGLDAIVAKPFDLNFPLLVEGATKEPALKSEETEQVDSANESDVQDSALDVQEDIEEPEKVEIENAYLYPRVVYSGISMNLAEPVIAHNQGINIDFSTVSTSMPLYIDFFQGDNMLSHTLWVDALGKANLELELPFKGLVRIQATSSLLSSSRQIAIKYVYFSEKGQSKIDSLMALFNETSQVDSKKWDRDLLKKADERQLNLLAAYLLAKNYKGHTEQKQIIKSRGDDDAALVAFKQRFQRILMVAIMLLGFAVAFIIAIVAHGAHRRQVVINKMIMEENIVDEQMDLLAQEEPWKHSDDQKIFKIRMGVQIGVLFILVLAAFVSIALLVMTMSWGETAGYLP